MTTGVVVETVFFIINIYFVASLVAVGYLIFRGRGGSLALLSSAPLIIYVVAFNVPAPYPTLYAAVSCMLLSLYLKFAGRELRVTLPYWGFTLLEGIIGAIMTSYKLYQTETYLFLTLALTVSLILLSASESMVGRRRVTPLAVRASLSLTVILWAMESYALIAFKGASWAHIIGRVHILALAFSALTIAYSVESRSPTLRIVSCFLGFLTGILTVSMVQGGVIATDLYVGRLEAVGSIYYLLPVIYAFTVALEEVRKVIVLPRIERPVYAVWGGLSFFTVLSLVGMAFESVKLVGPTQHLEVISAVFPYFTIASVMGLSVLRGLRWKSVLVAAFMILTSISTCYVAGVDFKLGWIIGYLLTLTLLMAAKGGDPFRIVPPILSLLIIAVLAVGFLQFSGLPTARYGFKAYMFGGQPVRPLPNLELRLETLHVSSVDVNSKSVHGSVIVDVQYRGKRYTLKLPYTYTYTGLEGWKFGGELSAAVVEPGYILWIRVSPGGEVLGSLRAVYFQAMTAGEYPAEIFGPLVVEGRIYPYITLYLILQLILSVIPALDYVVFRRMYMYTWAI